MEFSGKSVFLAGSIEMGKAENWQQRLSRELQNITVLNPRRDDWDNTWIQSIDNPQFREQVEWELEALEIANIIVIYFDKTTKSPITLLELGLFAHTGKLIVCCPNGYWRKGNVDIVCNRYGIEQVETINDLIRNLIKRTNNE
ncbi:hypothetical protein ES705_31429 [subsurface metagenome]